MNGLGIHPGVPDLAATAFEFAVNWLVQSTLILTAGLIIGRLLTTRGSAVQSLVYRTTLVAVLACPLATCLLSFCGVSGWSIKLPRDSRLENVDHVKRKGAVLDPFVALHVGEPPADRARPAEPSAPVGSELPMDNYQLAPSAAMSGSIVPANDVASVTASSTADQFPRPVPSDMPHSLLGIATLAAVLIWLGVSGVLAMRIAMAWTALQRLRRHAVHAEAETTAICRELSSRLGVSAPDVLRSPWLPSPCLAGIRRPSVLLPDTDKVLSVRDVLIHELAHLKRHDCHWNVLRRAATAVLWFQPLLWRLSSRLESTSDEVCDDYVIDLGGDRHEYAHQLVDIAELSSAPIGVAGVGIVSLHSMLARRVTRIMDPSRNLSMRVGNLLLAAVLAGGLLGTAFTGLVGLSPRATRADSEPDAEAKVVVGKDESRSTIQENGDVITIRGQVVDPDGSPSAGATIHIARWYWDPNVPKVPLATTVSDADGQFEVSYRKSQFNVDVQRPEMWKEVTIVASAANYGPAFVNRTDVDSNQDLTLRLVHDDVPIRGRVIDLEGNPISRVTVSVGSLAAAPEEKLDAWLDALRRGEVLWEARNRYLGKYTPDNPPGVPRAVVTDADGYFEFKGVGRERQIRVTFEGPTIAYSEATIVTRKIEPVVAIDGMPDPVWSRKHTVYGANCEIAVHPTQPVVGTVRDAETGEPLSGVAVEAYRMTERGISAQRQIRITSDNQGRYKLVGMPKGPGNQIIAVPNDDQPYLMREFDVPDQPGLEPIELNLELHRGVWITGRVIDRATDKPVAARVHYLPYRTNPFAQAITGSDGGRLDGYQSRYATDEAGNYRLVGLPGPAIVGVQCISNSFPRGMGHETISGLDERGNFPTYRAAG